MRLLKVGLIILGGVGLVGLAACGSGELANSDSSPAVTNSRESPVTESAAPGVARLKPHLLGTLQYLKQAVKLLSQVLII